MKRVGRELGIRYVLEGSVRKSGNRVRITCQLIDVGTGAHLWADRFDGPLEDIFDLQDKVASSVAGVIEPALQEAETRSFDRSPDDRPHRLRSLPARSCNGLVVGAANPGSVSSAGAGDCARSALWARSRLGRDVLLPALRRWVGHRPRGGQPKGHRFRAASLKNRRRRSGRHCQCCPGPVLFRRGHRRNDCVGRPCPCAEPELCTRLARRRHSSGFLRAIPTSRSSMPRPRCGSVRARVGTSLSLIGQAHFLARRFDEAVPKLLLAIQEDPASRRRIAISPPAMPIWGASPRRAPLSPGYGTSTARYGRLLPGSAVPSSASYTCQACGWRPAQTVTS